MPSPLARLALPLLLALSLVGGSTPAYADSGDIAKQLAELVTRLDKAAADEAVATDRLAAVNRRLRELEAELADARGDIGDRMRALYMTGAQVDPVLVMLTAPDATTALDRAALVQAATQDDTARMRHTAFVRRELTAQRAVAAKVLHDVEESRRTLAAGRERLTVLLREAQRTEAAEAAKRAAAARAAAARAQAIATARAKAAAAARARASRAARATRVAAVRIPAGIGGTACLVGPAHAYSDTWGAPRSGGRTHQGVDVFAPYGSPAYAVESGVITRAKSSSLGGLTLTLRGNSGDEYYYAHNSANLVGAGQRVQAGQQIARVGDSGNAKGTAPHVHFEVHPGGGIPVNPYPFVKRVCG